jgi:hypothetical protein
MLGAAVPCAGSVLPQDKIHAIYNEGDFPQTVQQIEAFRKANRTYPAEDSLFIAKHLGVIFAADPATREKGKYYMLQLLEIRPDADILDMYVSDEIYKVFDKVREEFRARRKTSPEPARTVGTGDTKPPVERPRKENPARKGGSGWYWAAGTVVVVGAAGAAYYLMQPGKAEDKYFDVPRPKP